MNPKCIILEIFTTGSVYPMLDDYEGPCRLFTEEEAAAEVDRLIKQSPNARYQVVTFCP